MRLVISFTAILFIFSCISYSDEIKDILANKDKELQSALKEFKNDSSVVNREKVISLMNGIFDFQIMGQKVLPKAVWESADKMSRNTFVSEFRRMIEMSSVKKLESYQSDSTLYDSAIVQNDKASLKATVWYKGRKTVLNYKLIKIDNQWKAWDLVMDDLSTIRTYKEQFATILQTKTLTELTDILKKKADSFQKVSK